MLKLSFLLLCLSNHLHFESHRVNFLTGKYTWLRAEKNYSACRQAKCATVTTVSAKAAFETLSRRHYMQEKKREDLQKIQRQKDKAMNDKFDKLQNTVNTLDTGIASVVSLLQQGDNNNPPAAAAAPPAAQEALQGGACVRVCLCHLFILHSNQSP
jgi:hypothetical protein